MEASAALLHPVINLVPFVAALTRTATYQTDKQNGTAKRCPGQGLHIQEQVRMLGFGHADSRCPRHRAQPHGPRPKYCARKVGLCKSDDGQYLNFKQSSANIKPPDYLHVEG